MDLLDIIPHWIEICIIILLYISAIIAICLAILSSCMWSIFSKGRRFPSVHVFMAVLCELVVNLNHFVSICSDNLVYTSSAALCDFSTFVNTSFALANLFWLGLVSYKLWCAVEYPFDKIKNYYFAQNVTIWFISFSVGGLMIAEGSVPVDYVGCWEKRQGYTQWVYAWLITMLIFSSFLFVFRALWKSRKGLWKSYQEAKVRIGYVVLMAFFALVGLARNITVRTSDTDVASLLALSYFLQGIVGSVMLLREPSCWPVNVQVPWQPRKAEYGHGYGPYEPLLASGESWDRMESSAVEQFAPNHEEYKPLCSMCNHRVPFPWEMGIEEGSQIWIRRLMVRSMFAACRVSAKKSMEEGDVNIRNLARDVLRENRKYKLQGCSFGPMEATMWDYCPLVFREIRKCSHITDEDYLEAMVPTVMHRDPRNDTGFTEGRGGGYFAYSRNGLFCIKTISQKEAKMLQEVAIGFMRHLQTAKVSYITRVLGLYRIQMHSGQNRYFIVMDNVFQGTLDIRERYDLKGSWVSRDHKLNPRARADSDRSTSTQKMAPLGLDVDFKLHRKNLSLSQDVRNALTDTIERDVSFLLSYKLMDYSLLLGVSRVKVEDEIKGFSHGFQLGGVKPKDVTRSRSTGMLSRANSTHSDLAEYAEKQNNPYLLMSTEGNRHGYVEVYYLAVIDFLTAYNQKKKLERMLKVYMQQKDRNGISAMPPVAYATRFLGFIRRVISPPEISEGLSDMDGMDEDFLIREDEELVEVHPNAGMGPTLPPIKIPNTKIIPQ